MSFLPTDIPDLRGYDSGVVLSNLSRLRTREERLGEQILAQLWELAGAVMQDAAGDPDTLTSILLALQSDREEPRAIPGQDVLPEYRTLLDRLRARDGLYARLVLYRYLDVRNPAGCCTVLPLRDVPPTVRGRVAYMTGSLADKAFLRFSEWLPGCRAADARSFVDACEEVYNGLCQFCILPLESAEEGRLAAFSRLIVRYGLQTIAVCDVTQRGVTDFGALALHSCAPGTGSRSFVAVRTVYRRGILSWFTLPARRRPLRMCWRLPTFAECALSVPTRFPQRMPPPFPVGGRMTGTNNRCRTAVCRSVCCLTPAPIPTTPGMRRICLSSFAG